jgi:type III secretion protein S
MDQAFTIDITAHALTLVLILSMPPIVLSTVVGLLISLIQALTQVQEQTLSFAIKLIVVTVVIIAMAPWAASEMFKFTENIFDMIPSLHR